MKKIYCIKEDFGRIGFDKSELFFSLKGMAKWLLDQKPIDGRFSTKIGGEEQSYDITAENLEKVMNESKQKTGLCASIFIAQDFFIQVVESWYILSTVNVND